jgi:hypothetical protein
METSSSPLFLTPAKALLRLAGRSIVFAGICSTEDEIVRGVLSTLSASIMGFMSCLIEVRLGAGDRPSRRAAFMVSRNMTRSIRDTTKSKPKRGRPKTTGAGQPQVVRMHDHQIAAIDAWIAMQEFEISRPEAIRRLVEIGLEAKGK